MINHVSVPKRYMTGMGFLQQGATCTEAPPEKQHMLTQYRMEPSLLEVFHLLLSALLGSHLILNDGSVFF